MKLTSTSETSFSRCRQYCWGPAKFFVCFFFVFANPFAESAHLIPGKPVRLHVVACADTNRYSPGIDTIFAHYQFADSLLLCGEVADAYDQRTPSALTTVSSPDPQALKIRTEPAGKILIEPQPAASSQIELLQLCVPEIKDLCAQIAIGITPAPFAVSHITTVNAQGGADVEFLDIHFTAPQVDSEAEQLLETIVFSDPATNRILELSKHNEKQMSPITIRLPLATAHSGSVAAAALAGKPTGFSNDSAIQSYPVVDGIGPVLRKATLYTHATGYYRWLLRSVDQFQKTDT